MFGKVPQAEAEKQALTDRLDKGSYRVPKSGKAAFAVVGKEWHGALRKQGRRAKADYRELLDKLRAPLSA